jgi:hypothetical protein
MVMKAVFNYFSDIRIERFQGTGYAELGDDDAEPQDSRLGF